MKKRMRATPKRGKRKSLRTTKKRTIRGPVKRTTRKKTAGRVRKAKYKEGEFVYSPQNPTEKRQINDVKVPKSAGAVVKYRLTLSDAKGKPKNSKYIAESSIRKTKRS